MKSTTTSLTALLCSSTAIWLNHAAFAQSPDAEGSRLEEVVVTATRQTSTVNRVPLSITAATQDSLDKQGLRNINDLQKAIPALNISAVQAGVAQFAIRGIVATQGAATTGVYLDDTPLQKRNNIGASANNGSPAPVLFDLQRVEVLRGPQGTLYGGSSQGGTVRFITTEPSLSEYSGKARAELSSVDGGGLSYEVGAAFGGPLIDDKLGFRVSALGRHTGGYIDMVDVYNNGALRDKDVNETDTAAFRGTLLWAVNERTKLSFGLYHSKIEEVAIGNNGYYLPNGSTFTTTAPCFDTSRQFGSSPAPTASVTCPNNAVPGQTVGGIYQRPAQTYGPFGYLGKYNTIDRIKNSIDSRFDVLNATLDYGFDFMNLKAITSYVSDKTSNVGPGNAAEVANSIATTAYPTAVGLPLFAPFPDYQGRTDSTNKRDGISEEIRLASLPDAQHLSWVGGIFLAQFKANGDYCQARDLDQFNQQLFGLTTVQRYGFPNLPNGCSVERHQKLQDSEIAGFGEVNYNLTDSLKLIGGVRVSKIEFKFNQAFFGPLTGWNVPTTANSGLTSGTVSETPITPKFGAQYQFTADNMVYVSAAKGFRSGGVNSPLSAGLCASGLAQVGLTVADIPTTYDADTVWSYEVGAKNRLFDGRVQINASLYQIDWKGVQLTVTGIPGCGQTYVTNAGMAQSRGFEFETQAVVFEGMTTSLAVGYTDAQYSEDAFGPRPLSGAPASILVRKGDLLQTPEWTVNVGTQYDFNVGSSWRAYVRADYSYLGDYVRGPGPGVSNYAPDTRVAAAVRRVDIRAGLIMDRWEINIFANNVLNSDDTVANAGGRSGCSIAQGAACTTFSNYNPLTSVAVTRPREIGVQSLYRF